MKTLYSFKDKLNEDTYEFILKRPSRSDAEEIEIFFASTLSYLMGRGIQTRAAVDKYYLDKHGGAIPKEQEKYYNDLKFKLYEKERELVKISTTDKAEKEKVESLLREYNELTDKLRTLEAGFGELYNNTAEIITRNKTVDYCLLNFSYFKKNDEEAKPLFAGEDDNPKKQLNKKYDAYDKLVEGENSEFYIKNVNKLTLLFSLWYLNAADSAEEFENILRNDFEKAEDVKEAEKQEAETVE